MRIHNLLKENILHFYIFILLARGQQKRIKKTIISMIPQKTKMYQRTSETHWEDNVVGDGKDIKQQGVAEIKLQNKHSQLDAEQRQSNSAGLQSTQKSRENGTDAAGSERPLARHEVEGATDKPHL